MEIIMKKINVPLLSLIISASLASSSAFALTTANTTINNTATISYAVGGTTQAEIGSSPTGNSLGAGAPTSFLVDRVVDLTVTAEGNVTVVPSGSVVTPKTITYTLANTGNDTETFTIAIDPAITATSDQFDVSNCSVTDAGANGTLTTATSITLAQETNTIVTIKCDIPVSSAAVKNNSTADIELKATAQTTATALTTADDPNAVETVYADEAANNNTSDTEARNGAHAALNTYIIETADLSLVKTSEVVCDPYNLTDNPKRIPGSVVKYTITVTNSSNANATAQDVIINDPIPSDMTYISAAPTECGATVSDSTTSVASGTVTLTGSETGGSTVISKTMEISPNSSATLVFYATVN